MSDDPLKEDDAVVAGNGLVYQKHDGMWWGTFTDWAEGLLWSDLEHPITVVYRAGAPVSSTDDGWWPAPIWRLGL